MAAGGVRARSIPALVAALGMLASLCLGPRPAHAVERQWHAGLDGAWMLSSFPEGSLSAFGGGAHLAYGVSDAFNLRLHADVAAFELPEPFTSALVHGAFFGAEYVVDIMQWVPYVGLTTGPVVVSFQEGVDQPARTVWHLGIDVPVGLGYQLTHHIAFLVEWRYRALLLGDGTTPSNSSLVVGRFELMWDTCAEPEMR